MKPRIGIVGANGNFGKLCVKELTPHASIQTFDSDGTSPLDSWWNTIFQKYIILCVPMRNLREVCKSMKNNLNESQFVIDVCSLKSFSQKILEEELPHVNRIHVHPLFGPQSAANGIKGQRIAITSDPTGVATDFCKTTLGLEVIPCTAEFHDREMAVSQALTHFIGRVVERMNISRGTMPTKSFEDLMKVMDLVKGSRRELFVDMQTLNPHAASVCDEFIAQAVGLTNDIENDKF
jgi:prephenate dehydrogenase